MIAIDALGRRHLTWADNRLSVFNPEMAIIPHELMHWMSIYRR